MTRHETVRREPHDYVCSECGGRSEKVRRGAFGPPEIVVYHLAGCRFEEFR